MVINGRLCPSAPAHTIPLTCIHSSMVRPFPFPNAPAARSNGARVRTRWVPRWPGWGARGVVRNGAHGRARLTRNGRVRRRTASRRRPEFDEQNRHRIIISGDRCESPAPCIRTVHHVPSQHVARAARKSYARRGEVKKNIYIYIL